MRYKNLFLFILLSVVWGSAFNAIKVGLNFFPPVLFAGLRYLFAGSIMVFYALLVSKRFFPRSKKEILQILVAGFFMIALYHVFLFVGEKNVSSGVASIIVSLSPVLTTGFAGVILPRERLGRVGLVGLGLGFVGLIFLVSPDISKLFSLSPSRVIILFAAASFAIGSVLTRFLETNLSIESMEAWAMIVGTFFMFIIGFGLGESFSAINWNLSGFLALTYLALVSSSIGFLIYFNLLQDLGPIEVNLVSYSAPVVATTIGVVYLDEVFTLKSFLSLLLIFIGFFLLKRNEIKREIDKISFK